MINIIAINFLIHLVTLSNITIEHNKPEDRLNISVMLLLIGVAFKMNNNDSLPNISYLTHMDKYHIASLVYHSLSVLQNVISNEISNVDSVECETNIAEYNYCLEDINYNSCFSGQYIGKSKFNNQITLVYKYWGFKKINIKIFSNGKLQMTGIQDPEWETKYVGNYLIKLLIHELVNM